MPSTYTTSLRLEEQGTGENNGTWGSRLNEKTIALVDEAVGGVNTFDCTTGSSFTLTTSNGASDEARKQVLQLSGTPVNNINIFIPAVSKTYDVDAATLAGTKTVTIITSTGTGVTFSSGMIGRVYCDGTNVNVVSKSVTGSAFGNMLFGTDNTGAMTPVSVGDGISLSSGTLSVPNQFPTGAIAPYAGSTAPTSWLMCYGQAVSRTTYADLFTAISNTYGNGDGTTTFNLPDLRGRSIFGLDNMGGSAANRITSAGSGVQSLTLGGSGGSEFVQAHAHQTTVNDPGHTHTYSSQGTLPNSGGGLGVSRSAGADTITTNSSTTGITVSVSSYGAGAAQNMPPVLMLNFIIKT